MKKGFTLIELLVVISIIGILIAVSMFGLQGARESSRDARRKSDLELIRSGLEIYKSDCGSYPLSLPVAGSALVGTGDTDSCDADNEYISAVPADPTTTTRNYAYYSEDGSEYELCASLEEGDDTPTCQRSCGSEVTCNYKVENP